VGVTSPDTTDEPTATPIEPGFVDGVEVACRTAALLCDTEGGCRGGNVGGENMLARRVLVSPPPEDCGCGDEDDGVGFETRRCLNGFNDCETGESGASAAVDDSVVDGEGFGGSGGGGDLTDGQELLLFAPTTGLVGPRPSTAPVPDTTEVGVDDPVIDIGASGGRRRVLRPVTPTPTLLPTEPDLDELIVGSSFTRFTDVLRRGS